MKNLKSSADSFYKKRIFVTGAGGFIGQMLVTTLNELQATTGCFDQVASPPSDFSVTADLLNTKVLFQALSEFNPEVIIHLAANRSRSRNINQLRPALEANFLTSVSLVEFAVQQSVSPVLICIGTAEEYGMQPAPFEESLQLSPVSPYSFSKSVTANLLEMAAKIWSMRSIILRPSVVYGPGQGEDMLIPSLIKSILTNQPVQLTPGNQLRDFVYVEDLIEAICLATISKSPTKYTAINIASGQSLTIKAVVEAIQTLTGQLGKVEFAALPYRDDEIMDYRCSIARAMEILGWKPRTEFNHGLLCTIDAVKQSLVGNVQR